MSNGAFGGIYRMFRGNGGLRGALLRRLAPIAG